MLIIICSVDEILSKLEEIAPGSNIPCKQTTYHVHNINIPYNIYFYFFVFIIIYLLLFIYDFFCSLILSVLCRYLYYLLYLHMLFFNGAQYSIFYFEYFIYFCIPTIESTCVLEKKIIIIKVIKNQLIFDFKIQRFCIFLFHRICI